MIWGLEVRQVAYAFEDFEVGLRDGLVHLLCGFEGDVGVFGAYDDEGGDGDAGEGFGVVLAERAASKGGGGSGGWRVGDHGEDLYGYFGVSLQ